MSHDNSNAFSVSAQSADYIRSTTFRNYTKDQMTELFVAYQSMPLREAAKRTGVAYGTAFWHMRQANVLKPWRQILEEKPVDLLPVDLAYLAGIIDGEGTVTVKKMRGGKVKPCVHISNTCYLLIEWLKTKLCGKSVYVSTRPATGSRLEAYGLHVEGLSYLPLFKALLPYLVIKKERMEILIEWCEIRLDQSRSEPYTERQKYLMQTIRDLNYKLFAKYPKEAPRTSLWKS